MDYMVCYVGLLVLFGCLLGFAGGVCLFWVLVLVYWLCDWLLFVYVPMVLCLINDLS